MPETHTQCQDKGAPVPWNDQKSPAQDQNQVKRGVKRANDKDPTSQPQDSLSKYSSAACHHKQGSRGKPKSFYESNKRQKVGHCAFDSVNKFKDQQGEGGNIEFGIQGKTYQPVLTANSKIPDRTSGQNNNDDAKDANSSQSVFKSEEENPKSGRKYGTRRERASSTSALNPCESIAEHVPTDEGKIKPSVGEIEAEVKSQLINPKGPPRPCDAWVRPVFPKNLTSQQKRARELFFERQKLPIYPHGPEIRRRLRTNDILILIGDTGCGKSTQVPQFLFDEKWRARQSFNVDGKNVSVGGVIAITQPRKIAATTLAKRVAAEMGCSLSDVNGTVGYAVRFDQFTPKRMAIKFVTEGMLLQDILEDPDLKKYSAVIVDEIHERTLDVDLVTGFLKKIVTGDNKGRQGVPLKVVLMSASVDTESIRNFFSDEERKELQGQNDTQPSVLSGPSLSIWEGVSSPNNDQIVDQSEVSNKMAGDNAAVINIHSSVPSATSEKRVHESPSLPETKPAKKVSVHLVEGRQYAIKEWYLPEAVRDYVDVALKTIHRIHTTRPYPGDILCFMTGEDDIKILSEMVAKMARESLDTREVPFLKIMPLYGKMDAASQQKVFEPLKTKRTRKVVIATNVAETSVTVPGVKYVIDSGKVKVKEFRPGLGLDSLLIKPISKSSAAQRKGRAGRETEGECYRLYTKAQFEDLPDYDVPEILRSDILHAVLTMKARGVENPMTFPLMNSPGPQAILGALSQLLALGALSPEGSITRIGSVLANFPLSPLYGRVIITASEIGDDCVLDAIDAIACLDAEGDIFKRPSSEKEVQETQSARESLSRREGDILTVLTAMRRYLAQPSRQERETWCQQHQVNAATMKNALLVREQLRFRSRKASLLSAKAGPWQADSEAISEERGADLLKCFLRSFHARTAVLHADKSYRTTAARNLIAIHPASVLQGRKCEAILYLQQVYTTKHFAKIVNVIQMDWLMEAVSATHGAR